MALVLIPGPDNAPSTAADWDKINKVLQTIGLDINSPARISGSKILRGSVIFFAGAWYVADADTTITGSVTDYVRLTNSAGTVTAAFVPSLSGVTFNRTWNGWYDSSLRLYIFDEVKAFGAGAITELASMTTWRPANAETAKLLSQPNATGWSNILLEDPCASGKVYTIDGMGGGVYSKILGATAGTTIKKGDYVNVGTAVLYVNGGVTINATSMILYAFNSAKYAMDIQIREGATILATVVIPEGETTPRTVPIGGTITGSSRTLTVYAKLRTVDKTIQMTWSLNGHLTITDPTFMDDFAIRRAGFVLS